MGAVEVSSSCKNLDLPSAVRCDLSVARLAHQRTTTATPTLPSFYSSIHSHNEWTMARSNKQAAFDQSFDLFFETDDKGWKESGTWGANAFDTSFESDPFEFSAVGSSFHPAPTHSATLFPTDPFGKSGKPTVQVAILEQLSALYDDVSTEGSISVEGSVFVKPSKLLTNLPFCLVLRDLLDHVERCEEKSAVCHNINDKVSRKGLHKSDRVFRVTLPRQVATEVAIMDYVCVPTLRPVPIVSELLHVLHASDISGFLHE